MNNENEEKEQQNRPIEERVFEAIRSGKVTMRSRWYFVLRDIMAMIAIIIVLLIAVYFASFVIFVLHQNGAWFVPVFGFAGWFALFSALPWILIILSAIFVVVLAFLVKRYPFGYRWPLLYSFLGIIFLISAVCFVFVGTSFYNAVFNSTASRDFPFLGSYYPGIGVLEPNDIHRGTVTQVGMDEFSLQDTSGDGSEVFIGPETKLALGAVFNVGDAVVVFGNRTASGTILAVGVEKLSE